MHSNIRLLRHAPPRPQACGSVVDDGGLTLQWEDDSKTTQCSVFLSAEVRPRAAFMRFIITTLPGPWLQRGAKNAAMLSELSAVLICHSYLPVSLPIRPPVHLTDSLLPFAAAPQLFSVFRHPEDSDVRFGIQYSALVDTLNVFKSQQEAGGRPLDLRYPGPEAELMLECVDTLTLYSYVVLIFLYS